MQQQLGWILLALLCCGAFGRMGNARGPGHFTLFYPKNWARRYSRAQDVQQGSALNKFSKEYEGQAETLLGMCSEDRIDGSTFLRQLFQSDRKDKYRQLAVSGSLLLLSRTSWPLGWRHTLFYASLAEPASADDIGAIELTSMSESKNSKKRIRVVLRFSISEEGTLQLVPAAFYSHMRRGEVEKLLDDLLFFVRPAARDAYAISRARFNQKLELNGISRRTKEEEQRSKLDRLLHPERYKKKRHSGLHAERGGGGGGSGRYTPSEATQARRVVRRGG